MRSVPIHIGFRGKQVNGVAEPLDTGKDDVPLSHAIYLEGKYLGTLGCNKDGWVFDRPADLDLVETLGEYLHAWYE
jgi:hypothetical protein